mgnify:FL=1
MKRLGSKVLSGFGYLFFVGLALLMLLPFVYMLVCSLQETYSPYLISFDISNYTLDNFRKTFAVSGFGCWVRNSIFISISGVLLTLAVCSLGAFAFAQKRFYGRKGLMNLLLLSMAIPFTATVVPLWLMMGKLHMIDNYFPLIAPIPSVLGLLLIRQAILALPKELFESARVDGCRDLRIYWSIVLPVIRPILMTVAIIYFARSWNSFLWPLIISNTDATRTLPVGLASIQGTHTINYGIVMAGSLLNFLPPFLVYVFFQRYFIAGIAGTGIKN